MRAQDTPSKCNGIIERLNSASVLERLYAAREARDCSNTEIGDALAALLLGDTPEIRRAALHSIQPFLHPGHMPALLAYGRDLIASSDASPYPADGVLTDPDSRLGSIERIYRSIYLLLEKNSKTQYGSHTSGELRRFLKIGLFGISDARAGQAESIVCYSMVGLSYLHEPVDSVLDAMENSSVEEQRFRCGLLALSHYQSRSLSDTDRARILKMVERGMQGSYRTRQIAIQWYAKSPDLPSLTAILRDEQPFQEPAARRMIETLPGSQGRVFAATALYANPWTSGEILRILSPGEAVNVLRVSKSYDSRQIPADSYFVETADGLRGWVQGQHLELDRKKN